MNNEAITKLINEMTLQEKLMQMFRFHLNYYTGNSTHFCNRGSDIRH